MAERLIDVGDVAIWTESFGQPDGEPVLLIMGASVQSIYWPDEFIHELVRAGCFVIRFDNRDTGQSTSFDFSKASYTLDDMANDALGVLDAYSIRAAHIAGLSMGGMITQVLMMRHPDRVQTASLLMTSPLSGGAGDDTQSATQEHDVTLLAAQDLPGPNADWVAQAVAWQATEAHTREEKIAKRIASLRMMLGPDEVFDETAKTELATREYDRALDYDAQDNHPLAIAGSRPSDRREQLSQVHIPTLVVHGTDDPILPYPHGVALADTIPGANLYTLEGVGHDLAPRYLEPIAQQMIALQARIS